MIKALGRTKDGRRLVVLGLSRQNCELLLEGKPIKVETPDLGIVDGPTIMLCAGETEESLEKTFAEFIPPRN